MIAKVRMNFTYKGKSYVAGDTIHVETQDEIDYLGAHVFVQDFRNPTTKQVKKAATKTVKKVSPRRKRKAEEAKKAKK